MTETPTPPPTLRDVLCWRVCWKGRIEGRTHPAFTVHSVEQEPEWPVGRKGLMLAQLWKMLAKPTTEGVFIMDGDVVIDQSDFQSMVWSVAHERTAVHVAPVRLWAKATGLPDWVWGHRHMVPPDQSDEATMKDWQTDIDDPDMFSFNLTWLPTRLMEGAIKRGLDQWIYPLVDKNMSETARELGIPVRVVRGDCHPRHTHY